VLLPELAASLGAARFLREIEIAAKLNHPNILTLHDSGRTGGQADGRSEDLLYYTMPYVEGESLRDRLDREKQLPIDEALSIAAEVAGALSHAHEHGVVHRDIKPENILLKDGHALVSDFGIAKAVTEAGGEKLTQTGITVGTVSYMSPEQGAGERDIDGRSDLYSLGCVLYEMIGGVPPFTGPSDQAILARHSLEAPPAVSTIRTSTPPGVEALIQQSLAKNPVDRFKTAEHLRVALTDPNAVATGTGSQLQRKLKTRMARAGIGVAVTAAVVFGVWRVLPTDSGFDAGVVAVLPFEVADSMERPLDAVSITNLLRSNFGYLERYRVVQPARVRKAVEDLCPTARVERSCGSLVARELRSQYHVTGTVTPVRGDSVQIVAYLTDEMEGRSIPPVSIRGSRADGYSLVRELFQELAVASASEGEPVVANAALSTVSLDAFAAFLDGELYLKSDFDSAETAFRRATEADSTFALAWYRLALIRDWFEDAGASAQAAAQAEAYAHKLSAHDRRLLQGYRAHLHGDPLPAEAIYLELLEEDPEDFEALMQLGYLYYHYGWRMGVSMAKGVEPLRRAKRLAPHFPAGAYLVWELVAGSTDDPSMLDEADSLAGGEGELALGIAAVRAIRQGDSLGLVVVMDSIRTLRPVNSMLMLPGFIRLGTIVGHVPDLAMWVRHLESVSDSAYLEQACAGDACDVNFWRRRGSRQIARSQAGRGRWSAARTAVRAMGELGSSWGAARLAVMATMPSPSHFPVDADSLQRELEAWDVGGSDYPLKLRWYLLGLLSAQRGDYETARAYADRLEALEPHEVLPTIHQDFAQGVRADVLLREGRPDGALAALERAPRRVHYGPGRSIPGDREVFLRARVLHALGRYDEAIRWYTPRMVRGIAPVLLAPSHYYRGQIYEEMGDTEKALLHYGAFVELWRDADPEHQPLVEEVKGRMARLAGEE